MFFYRSSAEEAIQRLHGSMIGQQIVRLSWGRTPTSKQVRWMACVFNVCTSIWGKAAVVHFIVNFLDMFIIHGIDQLLFYHIYEL